MNTAGHEADAVRRRVQLGEDSQIALPAEVRDALRVVTGDDVEFAAELAAGAGIFYENVDTLLAGLNGSRG